MLLFWLYVRISRSFVPSMPSDSLSLSLATWNVDGFQVSAAQRAAYASQILLDVKPDIIQLQEVVYENMAVFQSRLIDSGIYFDASPPPPMSGYYTSTLVRKRPHLRVGLVTGEP